MLERAWGGSFPWRRDGRSPEGRKPSRPRRRPRFESLEGRQLLAAALAPIAAVSVPSSLGYQVPLDGSASGAASQTFTVTSSNPDIKATVAQGPFVTVNVTHASSGAGDPAFSGSFTFQSFSDLTPNTSSRIASFTNAGGFNGTQFFRVVSDFSGVGGPTDTVIQGGPQPGSGTNPLELNQQLNFDEPGVVAIANAGANTDGDEFFVTTGPQTALDYGYTIFGQVVAGQSTVAEIGAVATQENSAGTEKSAPISPVNITAATTTATSPDGVVHIDATGAAPGETATITVTAHDPSTGTSATESFPVTVVANTATPPATSTLTFSPLSLPVSQPVITNTPTTIQLNTTTNIPAPATGTSATVTTAYALISQPAHGTITNLNTATGSLVYTPNPGYVGTDSFTYQATNNGGTPSAVAGNVATVSINVAPSTGAVRIIGDVLIVTPPPTSLKATNTIVVSQVNNATNAANDVLTVTVNGATDVDQPLVSTINRIIVFGSKASDDVTISPTVSSAIAVALDGGHGGTNVLQAGAGPTREHGWFGKTTLIGGTGANELVGRAGHVAFKPTATTDEIFAGAPHPGYSNYRQYNGRRSVSITPPGGTFYKLVNGKLTAIPTPKAARTTKTSSTAGSGATGGGTGTPGSTSGEATGSGGGSGTASGGSSTSSGSAAL